MPRTKSILVRDIPNAGDANYCGFCTSHDHRRCPEDGRCECAAQSHDPDDRVAAAMRLYGRLDLTGDTRENLATEWREGAR